MKTYLLLGRVFFSLIFVMSGLGHFQAETIAYAASQGVPMASLLVPFSGILALTGGLMIMFGSRTRLGAWLIVLFLVPVTVMMHRFWGLADPAAAMGQRAHFMKNLSMLGGALMIAYFGGGPYSFDAIRYRGKPRRVPEQPPREPAGV